MQFLKKFLQEILVQTKSLQILQPGRFAEEALPHADQHEWPVLNGCRNRFRHCSRLSRRQKLDWQDLHLSGTMAREAYVSAVSFDYD